MVDFDNKIKIFIGPIEIAGYYANLSKGFHSLGVDVDFVTFNSHPFGYGGEKKRPLLLRIVQYLNQLRGKIKRVIILNDLIALSSRLITFMWAISTIFKYDVFIFGFGQSLLWNNWDLNILRLLKKTVIVNLAHGTDARPPYVDGSYQSKDGKAQPTSNLLCSLSKQRINCVSRFHRLSNIVIGAPFSTTQFSDSRFINTFAIGAPLFIMHQDDDRNCCDKEKYENNSDLSVIRILHSPSHPSVKGTSKITNAIDNLKAKGYTIEFVLLESKTNCDVVKEIQRCDFVVDQIYSDTPMSGFATEAASYGKPAVVGGYRFDYLKEFISESMWPPSKLCQPDEIEEAIEDLIVNKDERLQIGKAAQSFVLKNRHPVVVAKNYMRLINGNIPDDWWIDPATVIYLEGCGQPVERSKENIRKMVAQFGVGSLQLAHKPHLEKAFLEFAEVNPR